MARANAAEVATDYQRFKDLTYEGFRALARDDGLSRYQKIGFPDSYREGHERAIFADVLAKLPALSEEGKVILDIGPGCSELPLLLIERCREAGHTLVLVDSPEMLDKLPDGPSIVKVPGRFPDEAGRVFAEFAGRVDAVLTYSVLQYVFAEQPVFDFIDRTLGLLAEGGRFLIGDVPNASKRKRFFRSAAGVRLHRSFSGTDGLPEVEFNVAEPGKIDDAVVLALLARCRAAGFDAYVLPQSAELPMANRREDVLITRP
jgi:hypothetical protein